MNSPWGLMPLLILCALMTCGLNARASTLTVSSLADSGPGTLRDQVAAAASGDTINFSVTGTITLTNSADMPIAKNLTITGPGAGSLTVNRTLYGTTIFSISSGIVGLSGLTISGGGGTRISTYNPTTGNLDNKNFGGAIYMTGGTVTIASTTLSTNGADEGGAIYEGGGTLALTNCILANNQASEFGGAIYVDFGGTLTVRSTTISGNLAFTSGAGIACFNTATIEDSTISANIVPLGGAVLGSGAGICNTVSGVMTIRNCTISGNSSLPTSGAGFTGGGGMRNFGVLTIANSTITDNFADKGGGIMSEPTATLDLSNTILAGNSVSGYGPDILSGPSTGTHNIIGQDPKIGPLANNGGPTLTHALLVGSPAIDAGDPNFDGTNTPYDQRGPGFPRVLNGRVCIGACESGFDQGSNLVVTTLDDHDDGIAGASDCTLREAVKYASVGGTITFSVAGTITLTGGEMLIAKSLTIIGPTGATGITVSGSNASRIFRVASGTAAVTNTVNFSSLTLTGGNGVSSTMSGVGGAIYTDTFTALAVTNCTFSGNHADTGGAIRNGATMTATGCTFSGNSGNINAGAIQNGPNLLTLKSSTFSGNSTTGSSANGNGNGGALRSGGNLTVTSCTFFGNSASVFGGGIYINTGGAPSLSNTIVAGNSAPTGPDINGIFTTGDYNLVQNTAGATLPGTHKITGQPALLGPLANNGGPTQTHALLAGSPAIDKGNTTLSGDQRGVFRPQGKADDIGAFEWQHQPTLSIQRIPLSQVQICWDTVTNTSYQLQYRSTLTTNQWSPLSAWIAGGGQMICTNDTMLVSGPQRFYQVGVINLP